MSGARLLLLALLALGAWVLEGCAGALIAMQAVPAAIGGAAIANAEDRGPFHVSMPAASSGDDLAALGEKVRRAECGNAEAQYWLAARLDNGYNAAPDYVQVYKWYRLAELGGFSGAGERRAALDARLPPADVARARALAEAFEPAAENCPATG